MYCNKCGCWVEDNQRFCNRCGNRILDTDNQQVIVNNNGLKCPHCGSRNINIQIVTESKLKNKHHGIFYWIFIGWWLELLLWLFLTIPRLLIFIFMPKKQKIVQNQKKVAICQNCGYSWNR